MPARPSGRRSVKMKNVYKDVRMFISVFNQIDAQNLFHNKFLFNVLETCRGMK